MRIETYEFEGAKYHDNMKGLYIDDLPEGYFTQGNKVYVALGVVSDCISFIDNDRKIHKTDSK